MPSQQRGSLILGVGSHWHTYLLLDRACDVSRLLVSKKRHVSLQTLVDRACDVKCRRRHSFVRRRHRRRRRRCHREAESIFPETSALASAGSWYPRVLVQLDHVYFSIAGFERARGMQTFCRTEPATSGGSWCPRGSLCCHVILRYPTGGGIALSSEQHDVPRMRASPAFHGCWQPIYVGCC